MRVEEEILKVLGIHAYAVQFAAAMLEEAKPDTSMDDWLVLLLLESKQKYEEASPEFLRAVLEINLAVVNREAK